MVSVRILRYQHSNEWVVCVYVWHGLPLIYHRAIRFGMKIVLIVL
jgi:hypothetical protein